MTPAAPVLHPPPEYLDDLEVLRRGLYGEGAPLRPVPVPAEVSGAATDCGALVLVDAEGVPVARVEEVAAADDGHVTGRPVWLGTSSDRPFERLHLTGPVDLSGREVVVVVRAADQVPDRVPRDAYLLVLASTSLDGPTAGTNTVRSALAAVAGDETRVGVVPVPPGDGDRARALLTTLGVDPSAATTPEPAGTGSGGDPRSDGAGVVLLLTGLSGSGKSTVARAVATRLVEDGASVTLLDGDVVRRHLTAGLGFSAADRRTNVRRIGWVAAEIAHHGGLAICSPIAPEDAVRRDVAAMATTRGARFVLVHVATPLEECERRDRKGLYAAARRGEIADFTGISAPYDVPEEPDLRIDTTGRDVASCADEVLALLGAPADRGGADAR